MNNKTQMTKAEGAAMQKIEAEAAAMARENGMKITSGVYVPGGDKRGLSKEQAMAATLEAHPELYTAYKKAKDAAVIVRTLEAAGITVR